MRILFAGTPEAAVKPLQALASAGGDMEVVAVLTRPDAPQGRGRRLAPSPVKAAAMELGLPVIEDKPTSDGFFEAVERFKPDIAAVVAYGSILRQPALDAVPLGWFNLHFSLLPQYRGAAPVQRAIWAGETVTGATVFKIGPGLDNGPVAAQSTVEIGAHETSGELLGRLSEDGSNLLCAALKGIADGHLALVEQPEGVFEPAPKIHPDDARIRFDVPAFAADRQIRACTPEPGAWCLLHNRTETDAQGADGGIKLTVARAHPDMSDNPQKPAGLRPGMIAVSKKHVWIGTLTDPLELDQVKQQGKKQMAAADWARGSRLPEGAYCD